MKGSIVISERQAFEALLKDAEAPFEGWDFSLVSGTERMQTAPWGWSYASVILPYVRSATAMLDMGTGGGEFLAKLRPLPEATVATEGYQPNISVARARLEPLGVTVCEIREDNQLPLEDERFDLIINRHEAYDPDEVLRVVKPGGSFITQQVGGADDLDLNRLLGADDHNPYAHWTADYAARELQRHSWTIDDQREDFTFTRYFDVGAIVYYLKAIPWQIKDFTVESYRDALWGVHQRIQREGYVDVRNHRFLIMARKP